MQSHPSDDTWSNASSTSAVQRTKKAPQVVKDDWDDSSDEEEVDNQKIWDDANSKAPMPEVVISPSSTAQTTFSPPPAVLQGPMRILKRPSASPSSSASDVRKGAPAETIQEREVRYQAARQRIFSAGEGADERDRKTPPQRNRSAASTPPINGIVRNPKGPPTPSSGQDDEQGFAARRKNEPSARSESDSVETP